MEGNRLTSKDGWRRRLGAKGQSRFVGLDRGIHSTHLAGTTYATHQGQRDGGYAAGIPGHWSTVGTTVGFSGGATKARPKLMP
jgi:hypothetical protein